MFTLKRLASTAMGNMYRLATESIPKLETRSSFYKSSWTLQALWFQELKKDKRRRNHPSGTKDKQEMVEQTKPFHRPLPPKLLSELSVPRENVEKGEESSGQLLEAESSTYQT
ncbi:hypothetical protein BTVI_92743 [Pitangus sulphuratus]|nr:hypothetical protein BTVI_92743 [Pitangus sulphuratus]